MLKLISAVTIAFLSICSTSVWARSFTDAGGRTVEIPDNVTRVLTAGPPASVLVYVLAPEKLTGWVREPSGEEKQFLLPAVRDLPTYGRLTGQGGTANMEAVIAAKPDLIIDVGSVNPTYISLADKVQQQTGIPYVLIDGSFENSAKTLRQVGELLGVSPRAEELAAYAETTLKDLGGGLPKCRPANGRRSIMVVARKGWRRVFPARSILKSSKLRVPPMLLPQPARAGLPMSRWSRCSAGTRTSFSAPARNSFPR